jgi:hypothetical protein
MYIMQLLPQILIWVNFGGNGRCRYIRFILWSFGIFCGHLVYFPRLGMLYQEKSGNPVSASSLTQIVYAFVNK